MISMILGSTDKVVFVNKIAPVTTEKRLEKKQSVF